MSDDDKTPVDRQDPLELILAAVQRTEAHARDTMLFSQRVHNAHIEVFERQKLTDEKVARIQRRRWAPALASVVAALFSLACAYAAAVR